MVLPFLFLRKNKEVKQMIVTLCGSTKFKQEFLNVA